MTARSLTKYTDHREGRTKASLILAICALATALNMLNHVAERRGALSDRLAALSEENIFERGTWPTDVEYPIVRGTAPAST